MKFGIASSSVLFQLISVPDKLIVRGLFFCDNKVLNGKNSWSYISLLVLILAIISTGCAPLQSDEEAIGKDEFATAVEGITSSVGAKVVNAEVLTVVPTTFVQHIRVVGEAEASQDITVSSEETGVIAAFLVGRGDNLVSGQPVARIDSTLLSAQVEEARALSELAIERFDRLRRLWEQQRIGTEISLLEAKAQSVSTAARLKILETRLIKTVVTSPVDGIFDRQFVDVGELVVPGASIFQVLVTDPVRVVAGIPERYALSVFPGTEAIVTFDIIIDQEYVSPIEFMGISVDPRSRTIPIEIVINNAEMLIRPFMVASVQVERIRQEQVIVVSQDLVQRTEEGFQVFVAELRDGDVIARAKNVELGSSYANEVVITRGLVSGDKLITAGHRQMDDGSPIRIVREIFNE